MLILAFSFLLILCLVASCLWSDDRHRKPIGFIIFTHLVLNFLSVIWSFKNCSFTCYKCFFFPSIFLSFFFKLTITPLPFLYTDGGCLFSCLNTILSEDLFWLSRAFTNIFWSISFFQSSNKLGSSFNPWDVGKISKAAILPLGSSPKKNIKWR